MGDIEQEVSENLIEAKIYRIEGIETLWFFTAEADIEIEFSIEFSVESEKAKLVLIYPDNTITTIAEKDSTSADDNEITQTLSIKKGLNRIKIVAAKDSKLEMKLSSTNGQFLKLGIDW